MNMKSYLYYLDCIEFVDSIEHYTCELLNLVDALSSLFLNVVMLVDSVRYPCPHKTMGGTWTFSSLWG